MGIANPFSLETSIGFPHFVRTATAQQRQLSSILLSVAQKEITMIECKELAGKVVRSISIFEDGSYGPEISIDFEDGSNFNACLGIKLSIEAKWTRDDGGQPQTLRDYTASAMAQ